MPPKSRICRRAASCPGWNRRRSPASSAWATRDNVIGLTVRSVTTAGFQAPLCTRHTCRGAEGLPIGRWCSRAAPKLHIDSSRGAEGYGPVTPRQPSRSDLREAGPPRTATSVRDQRLGKMRKCLAMHRSPSSIPTHPSATPTPCRAANAGRLPAGRRLRVRGMLRQLEVSYTFTGITHTLIEAGPSSIWRYASRRPPTWVVALSRPSGRLEPPVSTISVHPVGHWVPRNLVHDCTIGACRTGQERLVGTQPAGDDDRWRDSSHHWLNILAPDRRTGANWPSVSAAFIEFGGGALRLTWRALRPPKNGHR